MKRFFALTLLHLSAIAIFAVAAAAQPGQIQVMDLGSAFSASGAQQQQTGKQNQQVKQQKQRDCARQANEQNLRGDARQRFMQSCTGGS